MFYHVMVGTTDTEKAIEFYDTVLGALGYDPGVVDSKGRAFYLNKYGTFGVGLPIDGAPASHANGGTIGFRAETTEAVDAFHAAGIANGGEAIEEPPGLRKGISANLYIAYLRDPDGNKICAVHRQVS
ncbi:MAG: VOC family protein [Pseudomonadales bacterium]|nr:VOC family protein [Pseudomonadales bacterium]